MQKSEVNSSTMLRINGEPFDSLGSTSLTTSRSLRANAEPVEAKHSRSIKNQNLKFCIIIAIFAFYILNFLGCATVPKREALPTYNINGIAYLPLITLCNQRGISWEYDIITKTVVLDKDTHQLNLRVGDNLALVDGRSTHIEHPVDIYQGTVVIPYKFKEQILDVLFKESRPAAKFTLASSAIKKIVIDPGHGGRDPGAIGRTGLREKDVNLDIAKRLTKLLQEDGAEVILTRSTDTYVSLSRRVDIANNSRADIFISIHANANRVRRLNGFEIYYISPSVSDSQRALSCSRNAILDIDGKYFDHSTLNLKATLWDMIYTHNRAESIELARSICQKIDQDLEIKVLGIKGAGFYVLKGVRMPAVLAEVGFLSNYNEERRLKNSYYRQQITESIKQAIDNYAKDYTLAGLN